MKKLGLFGVFLFLAFAAVFVFVGCGKSDEEQVEQTLVKVRELEKENTSAGYLQAQYLLFTLSKQKPAFADREEALYEILKVHCLYFKLVFVNEDILERRTLVQMDYGLMIYDLAKKYIDLYPSGRHCPLMKKIISCWKEPPVPSPEEIAGETFDISKYNEKRFLHGISNLGGEEIINFCKTFDWDKYERDGTI
ncbi:MAG: hypothetical protein WC619_04360 [Patescibacteria group bacterium]